MSAVELFRTADVAVRHWQGFSRACCFVTFDSFTDYRTLDRQGFAEAFFGENEIDGIHLLSRENDWYQYPDMLDILARVRELTVGYTNVIAYGSSMGAYAAIRFGRLAGASTAFALSPQFSIDPAVVPFDRRWVHDGRRIKLLYEADPPPFVDTAIIVYDKHDLDARHADLYRDKTRIVDVPLLNCGHPCTGYLAELKLLQESCRALAEGVFDPSWLREAARARRRQAGQFYVALSLKARHIDTRMKLMERAVALSPGNFNYLAHFATAAAQNGHREAAVAAINRGMEIAPSHPVVRFHRSQVLELTGDLDGALDVMAELAGENGLYNARLNSLRGKLDRADAASWIDSALGADPLPRALKPRRGLADLRRRLAGTGFRLLRGHGIPPHSRRSVLPEIERAPVDTRVTTFPSPPPFASSWRRHDKLVRAVPRQRIDLMLVGDSIAEYWTDQVWAPWRVFNFGIAADKVQHVIWRLDEVTRRIPADRVLIVVGTNNLGAGDTSEGIVAGIREMCRRLALAAPDAEFLALEIPPCGPDFDFRDADRRETNRMLAAADWVRTINADAELTAGDAASNPYYMPDHIHLSPQGYELVSALVRGVWR